MELLDDTPRLPKIPFIIGDLILLSVAALLAYRMGSDPSTAEVVGIVVSTGLAVAVGLAPFIVGYARHQEKVLRDRERMLEKFVRSTGSAADQASIAARGLNEIAEKTQANLNRLDSLPATIQAAREAAAAQSSPAPSEALPKFRKELTTLRDELIAQNEALGARLDNAITALSNSIQTTTAEPSPAPLPATEPGKPKPARRKKSTAEAPSAASDDLLFGGDIVGPESPLPAAEPAETQPPKPVRKKKSASKIESVPKPDLSSAPVEDDSPSAFPSAASEPASPAPTEEPSAPPDRASPATATKPEVAVKAGKSLPEAPAADTDAGAKKSAQADISSATTADEPPPPSLTVTGNNVLDNPTPTKPAPSSDGMTRLTVTAYIGIGNRLFIRGDGPGLSRAEGIPLQFVSIGKWRWESDAATEPVKVTLWKNDEDECTSAGEIELPPGAQLETSAEF